MLMDLVQVRRHYSILKNKCNTTYTPENQKHP